MMAAGGLTVVFHSKLRQKSLEILFLEREGIAEFSLREKETGRSTYIKQSQWFPIERQGSIGYLLELSIQTL
jgi:hypothetical protein